MDVTAALWCKENAIVLCRTDNQNSLPSEHLKVFKHWQVKTCFHSTKYERLCNLTKLLMQLSPSECVIVVASGAMRSPLLMAWRHVRAWHMGNPARATHRRYKSLISSLHEMMYGYHLWRMWLWDSQISPDNRRTKNKKNHMMAAERIPTFPTQWAYRCNMRRCCNVTIVLGARRVREVCTGTLNLP